MVEKVDLGENSGGMNMAKLHYMKFPKNKN